METGVNVGVAPLTRWCSSGSRRPKASRDWGRRDAPIQEKRGQANEDRQGLSAPIQRTARHPQRPPWAFRLIKRASTAARIKRFGH